MKLQLNNHTKILCWYFFRLGAGFWAFSRILKCSDFRSRFPGITRHHLKACGVFFFFWSFEYPKPHPLNLTKNGFRAALTSLIIVTIHQKCCKWRWLKVWKCVMLFLRCEWLCPKHRTWSMKNVGFPFLQPNNPGNGSLTSLNIVTIHQKCCKWCWIKVCDAIFLRCECPKNQPWNLKRLVSFRLAQKPKNGIVAKKCARAVG